MVEVFGNILELSYSGSITIWILLLLRQALAGTDKKYIYYMWSIPWIKLIVPISSLAVWDMMKKQPVINPLLSICCNPIEQSGREFIRWYLGTLDYNLLQFLSIIWVAGALLLFIVTIVKYVRLQRRLAVSIKFKDGIYLSDGAVDPFVFGVIHPRIYLPSEMDSKHYPYVIMHEQMHIKRRDHLIKLLVEFIVIVHWFNPIVWIARHYMTVDMELSCDEQVIQSLGQDDRKEYAAALLQLSSKDEIIDLSVLAFGEDSVKRRILNLAERKPPSAFTRLMLSCLMVFMMIFLLPQFEGNKNVDSNISIDIDIQETGGGVLAPLFGFDWGC